MSIRSLAGTYCLFPQFALVGGVLCAITASGCAEGRVDRRDLVGTYRLAYPYGVEELLVRSDGTYQQSFAEDATSFTPINQGRWDLEQGSVWDGQILVLHDPVIVDDGFGRRANPKPSHAVWPVRIRKRWSAAIKLLVNDDLGFAFAKVQ